MTRDDIKKILGENATEEAITNTLNALHNETNTLKKELEETKAQQSRYSDYDAIKQQLDEINRANMTEQEKLNAQKEEIAKNLREARMIKSKARVLEVLAGKDIDDDIINKIVGEDEEVSVAVAMKLASKFDDVIAKAKQEKEQELATLNVKPNISNTNPNDDGKMSWEKFSSLSVEEQNKFANDNPEEFANL